MGDLIKVMRKYCELKGCRLCEIMAELSKEIDKINEKFGLNFQVPIIPCPYLREDLKPIIEAVKKAMEESWGRR